MNEVIITESYYCFECKNADSSPLRKKLKIKVRIFRIIFGDKRV